MSAKKPISCVADGDLMVVHVDEHPQTPVSLSKPMAWTEPAAQCAASRHFCHYRHFGPQL